MITINMPDKETALQIACNAGLLGVHGTNGKDNDDWLYECFVQIVKASTVKDKPQEPVCGYQSDDYYGHALYGA
jgi:hypothetical protein